ncbi:unnamed protein product [Adineta steineri]|uniref:Formate/nitrite transporter n=3 Tax=Adineta steineri TaxID=433720 RepID=A0A814MFX2_9BILA|nr:unnamed protein product [Adineta steineri]CAF1077921.1 unnamed protein product [Adineta steineri]
MSMSDAYNVYDTIQFISALGVKKAKQSIDHMIIKSVLAGVLLSFSGLFMLTVGGGGAPIEQNLGPGVLKMVQAAVFPIGLILIVITGGELFSGNIMTLVVSTLHGKTKWHHIIISWIVSFLGNLVGCIFFQYIFVYYAGLLTHDPYRSFTVHLAETKGSTQWHQLFLKGIAGNWLVCLAIWLGTSARELVSKIVGGFLPLWLFVAVGYEHAIANMFTVQMGMILGANLSIGKYIACVMIPVTLGNILGGGLFVGVTYWYLYLIEKVDTELKIDAKLPVSNTDEIIGKNETIVEIQEL